MLSDNKDSADVMNEAESSEDSESEVSENEEESDGLFDESSGEEPEDTVKVGMIIHCAFIC